MKHLLMLIWFPFALVLFSMLNGVLNSLITQPSGFNFNPAGVLGILIFIVSAVTIGELTLLVYKNLYKNP